MADLTLSLWSKRALIFIEGELPDSAADAAVEACSFEVEGHEYADSWQSGEWDGRVELFRQNTSGKWFFPIGLLPKVSRILELHGVSYDVDGLSRPGRGDTDYTWPGDLELREYQSDAITDALTAGSGIISMPTGAGKTVVGLRLINELQHPAIVLAHTTEIAEQWVTRASDRLDADVSRAFGGDFETGGDVTVALYQTLYDGGEVREHPALKAPVAVFDEVHRVGADTFSEVALTSLAPYRFGLSATPERSDNQTLRVIGGTGELICDVGVEDLIDDGYLAEPEWRLLDVPKADGRYRNWQSEYKAAIVENQTRNELLVDEVGSIPQPTLLTVEQINHGERLTSLLTDRGHDVAFVHGSASDREENLDAFRSGQLDVLVATSSLVGEGFDVPEIASFVVGGGKKSRVSILQQVGRALRPDTGTAVIVDALDKGTGGYKSWIGEHAAERLRVYRDYYGKYGP